MIRPSRPEALDTQGQAADLNLDWMSPAPSGRICLRRWKSVWLGGLVVMMSSVHRGFVPATHVMSGLQGTGDGWLAVANMTSVFDYELHSSYWLMLRLPLCFASTVR